MKNKLLISILICTLLACNYYNNKSQDLKQKENSSYYVKGINGPTFLQPVDKTLSLALAPTTYIIINFIDSTYCDIEYHGYRQLKASRMYELKEDGSLTIINPVNDKIRHYKIINENNSFYILNKQGTKVYKMLSADTLNSYINSSELKKAAFLYPALDEKEQQFGAEDQYKIDEDGHVNISEHPLKHKAREINIFELF